MESKNSLLRNSQKENTLEIVLRKSFQICEKVAFRTFQETLFGVSVSNIEAVNRCSKPVIELVLIMALVLPHKHIDNGT